MPITGVVASVIAAPYSNPASVTVTTRASNWIHGEARWRSALHYGTIFLIRISDMARIGTLTAVLVALLSGALEVRADTPRYSGWSIRMPTTMRDGGTDEIPATILKPPGDGPFAAVVVLHDCSGLSARSSGG